MKKVLVAVLILLVFASVAVAGDVSGNISINGMSQYVFRGFEYSGHSLVVQPSTTITYKGLSATVVANIDSNNTATQSVPVAYHSAYNETDVILSYTYKVDKVSITGGYINYGMKFIDNTEELYISASYDTLLTPTLSVYRDIKAYPATYINLSVSHSIPMTKATFPKIDASLDLNASIGYYIGSSDIWRTYEASTGAYTGKKHNAFHDGMVKAALTCPITKQITLQPYGQYWFPLSDDASKKINGNSFNYLGHIDNTFVYGLIVTYNF